MKSYVTFFLISVMSLGLIFLLVTRDREKHEAPAEIIEVKETVADAGADAGKTDARTLAGSDAAAPAMEAAAPTEKPLRVTTLGWELAAPGVGVPNTELAPESALDQIEARLARGGSDPQGADIAILPLPSFIASYERLRALEPKVFLVVGFSHGREELHANAGALLKAPGGADEVKVVSGGSESATTLALFGVDLLGVASSRLRIVAADAADAKAANFAGVVKGTTDSRKLAFSTADASHLVPIVAIAPKGVIDAREQALHAWSKAWLEGQTKVAADVPGIARRLASKDNLTLAANVGGAPEALVLVERLGLLERMTLEQETTFLGPLAKGPVTLDVLIAKTWQLERGGGLTTSAAPDPLPIDARVVSIIAPPPKDAPARAAPEGDAGAAFAPLPTGAVPLAAYRAVDGDTDKVAAQIFFLSGVFDRALFKVTAKGGEKAAKAIAAAARDKGVPPSRLATAAGEPPGAFASVELLAPP